MLIFPIQTETAPETPPSVCSSQTAVALLVENLVRTGTRGADGCEAGSTVCGRLGWPLRWHASSGPAHLGEF